MSTLNNKLDGRLEIPEDGWYLLEKLAITGKMEIEERITSGDGEEIYKVDFSDCRTRLTLDELLGDLYDLDVFWCKLTYTNKNFSHYIELDGDAGQYSIDTDYADNSDRL